MFNTQDSVPRAGEGGSATENLAKKVKAHIKMVRARHRLQQMSSVLDQIIRLERPRR